MLIFVQACRPTIYFCQGCISYFIIVSIFLYLDFILRFYSSLLGIKQIIIDIIIIIIIIILSSVTSDRSLNDSQYRSF